MPEDKNYKKILELNGEYQNFARDKEQDKMMIKYLQKEVKNADQQMDRLKKEISELSKQ